MTIWIYELFAPEALVQYVAIFLIVVGLAMPTIGLVRLLALAGGLVGIYVSGFVALDRAGLVWWSLLTLVVLVRLVVKDPRFLFGRFTPEEAEFRKAVVPELDRTNTRMLLRIGKWADAEPGHIFTKEGEAVDQLVYIARGKADIQVEGRKVSDVGAGALIGEVGVSTGEVATATTLAATKVRYLAFDTNRLYSLLDSHVAIQDAVELAVDRNLRDKLQRANQATVRAASGEAVSSPQ